MEEDIICDPDDAGDTPLTLNDWNLQVFQWLPNGYVLLRDTDYRDLYLFLSTGRKDNGVVVIHEVGYLPLYRLPATMPLLPLESS